MPQTFTASLHLYMAQKKSHKRPAGSHIQPKKPVTFIKLVGYPVSMFAILTIVDWKPFKIYMQEGGYFLKINDDNPVVVRLSVVS